MPSVSIIYASTSGHTEYVVDELTSVLSGFDVTKKRVELAGPEDLTNADALILASSTWNTGGPEGQLNPHMHAFVNGKGKSVDLKGKNVAVIGLGDERYFYTCRAAELLEDYVRKNGGTLVGTLRIVNEPYGQEETVKEWGKKLLTAFSK